MNVQGLPLDLDCEPDERRRYVSNFISILVRHGFISGNDTVNAINFFCGEQCSPINWHRGRNTLRYLFMLLEGQMPDINDTDFLQTSKKWVIAARAFQENGQPLDARQISGANNEVDVASKASPQARSLILHRNGNDRCLLWQ